MHSDWHCSVHCSVPLSPCTHLLYLLYCSSYPLEALCMTAAGNPVTPLIFPSRPPGSTSQPIYRISLLKSIALPSATPLNTVLSCMRGHSCLVLHIQKRMIPHAVAPSCVVLHHHRHDISQQISTETPQVHSNRQSKPLSPYWFVPTTAGRCDLNPQCHAFSHL